MGRLIAYIFIVIVFAILALGIADWYAHVNNLPEHYQPILRWPFPVMITCSLGACLIIMFFDWLETHH